MPITFLCLTPYLYILIVYQYDGIKVAGAGGIEPPVTVLETVGLPLTDAPTPELPPYSRILLPISFPYAAYASCKICKICSIEAYPDSVSCF